MTTYEVLGQGYAGQRRPDPRLAAAIGAAVGSTGSVLNVGAGTGSYEPAGAGVVALEPSRRMLGQRTRRDNAVEGVVEALPFPDDAFDVVLGVLTLHHWTDIARGLEECRRVARERVVLLTWDPEDPGFWLTQDYFPVVLELDRSIFPTMAELGESLPGARVERLPLPADCVDGFLCAYWRRPEAYLIPEVRRSMSTLMRIGPLEPGVERLRVDLESGAWRRRHGHLLDLEELELGYRLVTAPAG